MKKTFWKPRKIVGGLLGPLVLLAVSAPANAYPRPGRTELVSVSSDGEQANGTSAWPSMTPDGRYVAFDSSASNLVPGDTNVCSHVILRSISCTDVFVHDRQTGATERVSVASDGGEGNAESVAPFITPNGRYVAFGSVASNLVPDDGNRAQDVFVRDRQTGVTERVSVASGGAEGNGHSCCVSMSGDGRFVAFGSAASNLVPGDAAPLGLGAWDVFVHDRQSGTTERVSVASDGTPMSALYSSISEDGRSVAFESNANVLPGDTNGVTDVFVHDRQTGATERVSVASDGTQGNGHSLSSAPVGRGLSPDGRYVAFSSFASNLVPGDTNLVIDVFVHDRETGATERVSVASDGSEGIDGSLQPSITPDGRYVAFNSWATNLVPGDTNWNPTLFEGMDVFVRDRETGATERVSVASDGTEGDRTSAYGSLSADGRHVAFWSWATNLVPGDVNGPQTEWIGDGEDVFVRDRGLPVGVSEISALPEGERITVSGRATFSGQVAGSASDPPGDGVPGAGPSGADLIGASLTHRPEQNDLLVRLRLESLPGVGVCAGAVVTQCGASGAGTARLIYYGFQLDIGNARYEVRAYPSVAARLRPDFPPPGEAHFGLYECDPDCTEKAPLTGGIGTTGPEVRVSVPISLLASSEGAALRGMRAFTALGNEDVQSGASVVLDEVDLPDITLPGTNVRLGIAPAGALEEGVVFDIEAELVDGAFSGSVDASTLAAGEYEVWARACVGQRCGSSSTSIRLG